MLADSTDDLRIYPVAHQGIEYDVHGTLRYLSEEQEDLGFRPMVWQGLYNDRIRHIHCTGSVPADSDTGYQYAADHLLCQSSRQSVHVYPDVLVTEFFQT